MENAPDTDQPSQVPKWSDYPGLAEHMAARFASVAALPDAELQAHTEAVYEKDYVTNAFVYVRDHYPDKMAEKLGVSVEAVGNMSPEEMVAQLKRHTEQTPVEELRSQYIKSQQRFVEMLQEEKAGENEAGSSAG